MTHDPQCSAHEDGFSWCIHEEAARQAVANAAIEGLTVSAETQKLLAPLAAGEVSIEDVIRDIEVRHGVALVKAREDERSNNFTPDDFSEAMTEAYQRGLNDAREAVELIPAPYKVVGNFETYGPYHEGRSDMKDMALSAIDALKEDQ